MGDIKRFTWVLVNMTVAENISYLRFSPSQFQPLFTKQSNIANVNKEFTSSRFKYTIFRDNNLGHYDTSCTVFTSLFHTEFGVTQILVRLMGISSLLI